MNNDFKARAITKSSDLEVWENNGKSIEAGFPLAEGKKFLRFALK